MSIVAAGGLPELPPPNYEYITSVEDAQRALNEIDRYDIVEVDTETTALDTLVARLCLIQLGVIGKSYVFDVREGRVPTELFKPLLESRDKLKLIQNAVYDYEILKQCAGISVKRLYDTMLVEQLLHLGTFARANLQHLVAKYLHMNMPKDIATSFQDYHQEYDEYQLRYAANDVVVLRDIYNLQLSRLRQEGLMRTAKLEFDFVECMAEMELNGMLLDVPQWRGILREKIIERDKFRIQLSDTFNNSIDQNTMFGVSLINLDSPIQVVKALQNAGIPVESSDVKELNKYKKHSLVKLLLDYRKMEKFITTYGEPMINRIHEKTGRLHTRFKQMVSTGRMSSSDPNLQNIPKHQMYRSCFIARPGHKLLTTDMDGAELRIIANLSGDPTWVKIFNEGGDLHTISAASAFGVSEEEVVIDKEKDDTDPTKKHYRSNSKPISFGLAYGLSEHGLALRLGITKEAAKKMIDNYFKKYPAVQRFLDKAGRDAVRNGYATSIIGRKRYFNLPEPTDPKFRIQKGVIERAGKNHPIQGCLIFDTHIKGIGKIGDCVDKSIDIETGFGPNRALGVYSGNKEVYELKLSNGIKLGITKDHLIPVCTDEGVIDKKVSEVNFDEDVLMVPLNTIDGEATDTSGYEYKKSHWRATYADYPYPYIMDEKLSFVIGCLIGDGNYSRHDYVNFVCRESQRELFDKFNSYVKDIFDYDVVINDSKKKNEILLYSQASSVVIRGFLKHVGLDYVVNREKSIPKCFFTETLENKGALLDGLFSTDCGVTKESGPNYTTVSKQLANDIHQLLFSVGINSNLKEYENEYGKVYRIQVPKRFIDKFLTYVGASVNSKRERLLRELDKFSGKDNSLVPKFIPEIIYKSLHASGIYNNLTYNEKCHLRRFKTGSCSFTSWRKFSNLIESGENKNFLNRFYDYDFCKPISLKAIGHKDTYDLVCEKDPRYFIANGVILHNSNADTIKQAMIYAVNRLEKYGDAARLLLTVHDELIVEARDDLVEEVKPIVEQSVRDGFDTFFDKVKMSASADVADHWVKG